MDYWIAKPSRERKQDYVWEHCSILFFHRSFRLPVLSRSGVYGIRHPWRDNQYVLRTDMVSVCSDDSSCLVFSSRTVGVVLFAGSNEVALFDKINCGEIFAWHQILFTMRLQFVEQLLGTDGVVVVMQGEGV